MSKTSSAMITFDSSTHTFMCSGLWSITEIEFLKKSFFQQKPSDLTALRFNGKDLTHFDSAAALALHEMVQQCDYDHQKVEMEGFKEQYLALYQLLIKKKEVLHFQPSPPKQKNILHRIGVETITKITQADGFIILVGEISLKIMEAIGNWSRFRLPSIIATIETAGLQALPIVALLSFLIGVVLAYQMGLQLQTYGANSFIAYLSGMAIFREFSPLITAIIIAGRTSSAFTAQLGSMKINEEIDALQTMGLSPTELLVVPKVLGLVIVFPLLIFWSDCFSIFGAMYMSKGMLGIDYYDFLLRLKDSVGFKQFMLGLYKAPAFALLIAIVGCYQGFLVESNSDSIGTQTTRSVVQALFLIIITDAIYSVVYSWMDL